MARAELTLLAAHTSKAQAARAVLRAGFVDRIVADEGLATLLLEEKHEGILAFTQGMWTMAWDSAGSQRAIAAATTHKFDFIEIALLTPDAVDAAASRAMLERAELPAVCSLGLPKAVWPSRNGPDDAVAFLTNALDVADAMGAKALTGVTYGGIGETTGLPRQRRSWTMWPKRWSVPPPMPPDWDCDLGSNRSTATRRI